MATTTTTTRGILAGTAAAAVLLVQGISGAAENAGENAAAAVDPVQQVAVGLIGAGGFGGGSSYELGDDAGDLQGLVPAQNTGRRQRMVSEKTLARRRERFGS